MRPHLSHLDPYNFLAFTGKPNAVLVIVITKYVLKI